MLLALGYLCDGNEDLSWWIYLRKHKDIYIFLPFPETQIIQVVEILLPGMVSIMTADDLVIHEARASAAML